MGDELLMGSRRAFTLVELLLVVLILGAVVVISVPNISSVLGGTQSAASLRVLTQMGRYTRSMALLNQVPCELVVDLDARTLTTEMVERKGGGVAQASSEGGAFSDGATRFGQESLVEPGVTATVSFGRAVSERDRSSSERILERTKPVGEEMEGGADDEGSLADAIRMVQKLPGDAPIAFLGYSDRVERARFRELHTSGDGETNGVFRIRYRTNGTCRPYRIAVGLEGEESRAVVTVDSVGTPRVLRENMEREVEEKEQKKRW